jgi:hypothetical protein
MFIIFAVPYLSIRLAGYSVDLEINHDIHKLTQTSCVIYKKKNTSLGQ